MSGYYGSATSPIDDEGWLSTGDLGRMDEAGYIWITGRCKDLIIRGGENVAPAAVEQALVAAPGVRDAVVFGLSHPDLGEEVAAVIVVDEGVLSCGDRGARANASGVFCRSDMVAVPDRAAASESNREGRQASGGGAGARGTRRAESLVVGNASFRHLAPASRIFYGDDCLKHLPAELARSGAKRAVVFCGRTLARATPGLSTIQAALGPLCAGVFAGVVEQSPLAAVEDGVEELRRLECGRGHRAGWRVGRRDGASGDSALWRGGNRSRALYGVHPGPAAGEPQTREAEAAAVCRPHARRLLPTPRAEPRWCFPVAGA